MGGPSRRSPCRHEAAVTDVLVGYPIVLGRFARAGRGSGATTEPVIDIQHYGVVNDTAGRASGGRCNSLSQRSSAGERSGFVKQRRRIPLAEPVRSGDRSPLRHDASTPRVTVASGAQLSCQGSSRSTPEFSKSLVFRVARAQSFVRQIAAICASKPSIGCPSRSRVSTIWE